MQNQEMGCEFSDEEEESDGYYVSGPPQVTTCGPYVQEFESIPINSPQSSLNPKAAEFRMPEPRTSTDHSITPAESCDTGEAVPQSLTQSDHVVIDIPEDEVMDTTVVTDPTPIHGIDNTEDSFPEAPEGHTEAKCEGEHSGLRHSHRERHPPPKFTYDELGKPLILALSQFFSKLQEIIPNHQIP